MSGIVWMFDYILWCCWYHWSGWHAFEIWKFWLHFQSSRISPFSLVRNIFAHYFDTRLILVAFLEYSNSRYISSTGMIIILTHVFTDTPSISTIEPVGNIADFPLIVDIVIFSLICVTIATSVEGNMKTPKSFVSTFGVINSASATSAILYTVFAFLGSLKYGANTQDNVTLNLPSNAMYVWTVEMISVSNT